MKTFNPQTLKKIQDSVRLGLVRKQSEGDLSIYTYTQKCEVTDGWNSITKRCRGLVLDSNGNIIINCIPKFFNIGQKHSAELTLESDNISITEKNDGYLIQITNNELYGFIVTSKGSFSSKMALCAKEMVLPYKNEFKKNWTYICELDCNFPGDEGIIVTRWKDTKKLVCWAVRNEDLEEVEIEELPSCLEKVKEFTLDEAKEYLKRKDIEGVVLKDKTTKERVKVKTAHFMELHRLISGINERAVLSQLSKGEDPLQVTLPDEFLPSIKKWIKNFKTQYQEIEQKFFSYSKEYKEKDNKEIAMSQIPPLYKSLLFAERKGGKIEEIIWKEIERRRKENGKED